MKEEAKEHLTLDEAIAREIARLQDEVIPAMYGAPGGLTAVTHVWRDVYAAENARDVGDFVAMCNAYDALKAWQL